MVTETIECSWFAALSFISKVLLVVINPPPKTHEAEHLDEWLKAIIQLLNASGPCGKTVTHGRDIAGFVHVHIDCPIAGKFRIGLRSETSEATIYMEVDSIKVFEVWKDFLRTREEFEAICGS